MKTLTIIALSFLLAVSTQAQTPTSTAPSGLSLDRGWQTPLQGGSATLHDLGTLLSPFAKPSANLAPSPGLKVFDAVTYLMPLEEAKKVLNLNQRVIPKNKVNCPGFPKDSFFHYAFDGVFEGHFNKLYLVTDKADQVVAVQLVAESPKKDQIDAPYNPTDWHTYNFVLARSKAIRRLWVDHKPFFLEMDRSKGKEVWNDYDSKYTFKQPKGEVNMLRIDSLLMDPGRREGYRDSDWKALEAVRLYLPKPMMELILHCINLSGR